MTFASCTLPRRTRHFTENKGMLILINIAYQANHRDVDVPMHVFRGRHSVTNSKAAKLTRQEFVKALSLSLPQLARPDVS